MGLDTQASDYVTGLELEDGFGHALHVDGAHMAQAPPRPWDRMGRQRAESPLLRRASVAFVWYVSYWNVMVGA